MDEGPLPILRPARREDLESVIRFSQEAGIGITTIPKHIPLLEKKLNASLKSFSGQIPSDERATYLFALEMDGKVIGISAIFSRIAVKESFYAYHLLNERKQSPLLGIDFKISVLHFIRARKKPSEIGTLFLEKAYRKKEYGKLLSLGRFLFIAANRALFSPMIIAELRGMNEKGDSPFWNGVGRHFFKFDFPTADLLRTAHPETLHDLFPEHPLYVSLLPEAARAAIGQPHEETLPAKFILEKQGFQKSHYVDIFDAGPHLYANTDNIKIIKESGVAHVHEFNEEIDGKKMLICNPRLKSFRASICNGEITEEGSLLLSPSVADALEVRKGEQLRYAFY